MTRSEKRKGIFTSFDLWHLILFFACIKLLIHLLTYCNFDLHRDAYLYYALSEHLSWGYISIPPFTALIAKIATLIFGNTIFAMRFFPALSGAINVVIIGLAVRELGGKKIAISLASLAYILSPAYLHTNFLLQPVSFNHLFWLLSGYLILKMVKHENPRLWIGLGLVFGIAFLNKYSVLFFYAAFAISLIITKYRRLFVSKYFIIAVGVAIVIVLPNLFWQYNHNWPVVRHMSELRESQLVHVRLSDFIKDQLLMNAHAFVLWSGAVVILLFFRKERQYRLFGLIFCFVIILLMLGRGKSYYTLGIYPLMFVFGAYFTEKYIKKYLSFVFGFLVLFMLITLYFSLRFDGIPLSSYKSTAKADTFRWEDGVYHDIPQDMADMTGWREVGKSVTSVFLALNEKERDNCDVFCYNYGQGGSVMFYGKQNGVPQPISSAGSFVFWSPDSLTKDYIIWVHNPGDVDFDADSLLPELFNTVELKHIVDNIYFRENGTRIYLCKYPSEDYKIHYKERIKEFKDRYRYE